MTKFEPANINSVNGYDVILVDGVFRVYQIDDRDGLIQLGSDFERFEQAAEFALSLPHALNKGGG